MNVLAMWIAMVAVAVALTFFFPGSQLQPQLTGPALAADLPSTGDFTVAAWITPADSAEDGYALLKGRADGALQGFGLGIANRRPFVAIGDQDSSILIQGPMPVQGRTQLAAMRQGRVLRLFVNGLPVAEAVATAALPADPLQAGTLPGDHTFRGTVEGVTIFLAARSDADLRQRYAADAGVAQ
ncbi:MAG: LamG domain-containing protein [Candidatus Aenigmarchaeota archaeon]|nr:LamG domain-containing protein [Candidatus Aenigmarchaeota archaeon]